VERKGHTIVPLKLYWKHGKVKLEIGLAKASRRTTSARPRRTATGSAEAAAAAQPLADGG